MGIKQMDINLFFTELNDSWNQLSGTIHCFILILDNGLSISINNQQSDKCKLECYNYLKKSISVFNNFQLNLLCLLYPK